jgi:hypothetical protein
MPVATMKSGRTALVGSVGELHANAPRTTGANIIRRTIRVLVVSSRFLCACASERRIAVFHAFSAIDCNSLVSLRNRD